MKKVLLKIAIGPAIVFLILVASLPVRAEDLNYSVSVEPALNITTSASKVSLNLNPLTHDFDSQDLQVSVSTNNENGYLLVLTADNTFLTEKTDNTLLINTLDSSDAGYTESNFTANRWGYKYGTQTNYFPFISYTRLNSSTTAIENDTTNLSFAAKVDNDTAPGSYELALNFQAVSGVSIRYMQDLDPIACNVNAPTTVVDSRDNETYLVQRLADGKCWMLDNLRLRTTTVGLTNENSNVPYTKDNPWYLPNSISSGSRSYTVKQINSGSLNKKVTNWGIGSGLVGVYYNYCAVSAGTYCYASSAGTGDAQYDICPKGWRMPTTYSDDSDVKKLFAAYNSPLNVRVALSLNLSGVFEPAGGTSQQNSYGYFWTSTRKDGSAMWRIRATTSTANVNSGDSRFFAHTVRCILD